MAVRKPVKFRNGLNVNEPSTFGNIFVTGGNVGIGKTAPSYVLDILGDINLSGQLFQSGSSFVTSQWTGSVGSALSYTSGIVIMTESSISNLTVNSLLTTNISATNITVLNLQAVNETVTNLTVVNESIQNLIVSNDVSISDNLIALGNSNTVGAIFTTGGNVGIGNGSPIGRLHTVMDSATANGDAALWDSTYAVFGQASASGGAVGLGYHAVSGGSLSSITPGVAWRRMVYRADSHNFFAQGDNQRMIINNSGNVGIGTTSPNATLDVAGTFEVSAGSGYMFFNSAGNLGINITSPNTRLDVAGTFEVSSGNGYMFFNSAGNLGLNNTSPNATLDVAGTFEVSSGSGYLFFNTAGNLGLNTTIANWELTLNGPSNSSQGPHIWITNDNSTFPTFQQLNWIPDNISLMFDMYFDGAGSWRASRTGTNFQIYKINNRLDFNSVSGSAGSSVSLTSRLTIGSSGNVGVGTTSPSHQLQVETTNTLGNLFLGNNVQNRKLLLYDANNNQHQFYGLGLNANVLRFQVESTGAAYRFFSGTSATSSNEVFTILGSGNVGIGTTSPIGRLHTVMDSATANGAPGLWDSTYAVFGQTSANAGAVGLGYHAVSGGSLSSITPGVAWRRMVYRADSHNFFAQGDNQRMIINNSGNIGIGTTSPQGILDVVGSDSVFSIFRGNANDANSKTTLNAVNANCALSPLMFGTSFYFYGRFGGTNYRLISGASTYFTGQHGNQPIEGQEYLKTDIEDYVGLIVSSADEGYVSVNPITNQEITGKDAIQISESLPKIKLSNIDHDKAVWGVITNVKNENYNSDGTIEKDNQTEWGDRLTENTIRINGLGEGAIWVTNKNGNIINGDYITSSSIPGYGQRQNSEFLANYTVAKATCSVDFTNLEILNTKYNIRFINGNGTVISEEEYNISNENVYIAAFIGCSYHCS